MPKSENYRVYTRKRNLEPGEEIMAMGIHDVIATSREEAEDVVSNSDMEAVRSMKAKPRSEQNY